MRHPLLLALILSGLTSSVWAGPREDYAADSQHIATRYADDKKLCSEEADSGRRMQCLRDAKVEYNKSMDAAKARLKAAPVACRDCARVLSVHVSEKAGEGSALGVIAGGVAGALLGNQVGSGHGRQLATVAGAAGGAYAGNQVEKKVKSTKVWTVNVQYDTGEHASFNFDHDPGMKSGDPVRKDNSVLVRR